MAPHFTLGLAIFFVFSILALLEVWKSFICIQIRFIRYRLG
jgi:hypothetical protein